MENGEKEEKEEEWKTGGEEWGQVEGEKEEGVKRGGCMCIQRSKASEISWKQVQVDILKRELTAKRIKQNEQGADF